MSVGEIRYGQSCVADEHEAVAEFYRAVMQPDIELVIFFCSSLYDLDAVGSEIKRLFAGNMVLGCTSAGEIGPQGYFQHSLTGVSFSSRCCTAAAGLFTGLDAFDLVKSNDFCRALVDQFSQKIEGSERENSFALMLIDGLSMREEQIAHAFQYAAGKIPLFGGSASDDLHFNKTFVYHDGGFHSDCVALAFIHTKLPFRIFKTQHFVCSDKRLVVTGADVGKRIVSEINGLPAADEYGRLIGVDSRQLAPGHFAASPLVVKINGADYVRAIQKVNADGTLTFFCAIEEGLVLRIAHGVNLLTNLQETLGAIVAEIGPIQLVLACDCILRNLEIAAKDLRPEVGKIFARYKVIGFSSYGEQYHGVHVSQTLVGIALGRGSESMEDRGE